MKVSELMVTELAVVNEDISIREAVIQLADARVHAMPVVDRRGRLLGVLSSSDIVQTTAERRTAGDTDEMFDDMVVGDIMTTPPKTIGPDEDVRAAAQEMLRLDVHRLFVVQQKDLLGVVAQSDIVRAVADNRL
jgi:CBS domain-containing protein